jgi:hypothetical protein
LTEKVSPEATDESPMVTIRTSSDLFAIAFSREGEG